MQDIIKRLEKKAQEYGQLFAKYRAFAEQAQGAQHALYEQIALLRKDLEENRKPEINFNEVKPDVKERIQPQDGIREHSPGDQSRTPPQTSNRYCDVSRPQSGKKSWEIPQSTT